MTIQNTKFISRNEKNTHLTPYKAKERNYGLLVCIFHTVLIKE